MSSRSRSASPAPRDDTDLLYDKSDSDSDSEVDEKVEEQEEEAAGKLRLLRTYKCSNGSYIRQYQVLDPELQMSADLFEETWKTQPEFKGMIALKRKSQAYGRSYFFNGIDHKAIPIKSKAHKAVVAFATEREADRTYNQILDNFYEDGNVAIGAHSDDERDLRAKMAIYSYTYYEKDGKEMTENQIRVFKIHDKKSGRVIESWPMGHNTLIVMDGRSQLVTKHSVPTQTNGCRRINRTVRVSKRKKDWCLKCEAPQGLPHETSLREANYTHDCGEDGDCKSILGCWKCNPDPNVCDVCKCPVCDDCFNTCENCEEVICDRCFRFASACKQCSAE